MSLSLVSRACCGLVGVLKAAVLALPVVLVVGLVAVDWYVFVIQWALGQPHDNVAGVYALVRERTHTARRNDSGGGRTRKSERRRRASSVTHVGAVCLVSALLRLLWVALQVVLFSIIVFMVLWSYARTIVTSSSVRDNPPPADYFHKIRQMFPGQPEVTPTTAHTHAQWRGEHSGAANGSRCVSLKFRMHACPCPPPAHVSQV